MATTFQELIGIMDRKPSTIGTPGEGEVRYSLLDLQREVRSAEGEFLVLDDEMLLTPFYVDEGTYELYFFDMNLCFTEKEKDRRATASEPGHSWSDEISDNLTRYETSEEHPVVPKDVLDRYFEFLKRSYLVRSEVVQVFRKKPDLSKYYISVY